MKTPAMKEQMREAPCHYSNNEASAWESGYESGYQAALSAVPAQNNLWSIERSYDMGKVYDADGNFVAMTYGKDAQEFVDAHNATCVFQQPAQEPVKQESKIHRRIDRLVKRLEDYKLKYNGKEREFTFHAGYDMGYVEGQLSILEELPPVEVKE